MIGPCIGAVLGARMLALVAGTDVLVGAEADVLVGAGVDVLAPPRKVEPSTGDPVGTGATVAASPDPTGVANGEPRFKRALVDLKARRFHVAAMAFESLWQEGRSTRVLSFAAQAREGAGHWAHAIEHMRVLLAEETAMEPRQRARLTARRLAARRHTLPVLLRFAADDGVATEARVSLRRVAPDEVRPLLVIAATDGQVVDVDPGVWSLTVEAPGFRPRQIVLAFPRRSPREDPPAEEVVFPLERIVVATTLAFAPAEAAEGGAQWTLTLEGGEGGGALRMIGGAQAIERLSLVPGRWRARVEAVGYEAQEITWVAGEEEPPAVTLRASAPPPVAVAVAGPGPRAVDPGQGLGLGLGLAGGASFGIGVGLLVQNRKSYARFTRAPDNAGFVAAVTASDVGAGMLGAGVGLAIAAVSSGLPGRGISNRGLWAEVGVGAGVALIGAAWYAREWPRVQRDLYGQGDAMSDPDKNLHRETTAAAFLGAGVGMATGAGVALLTRFLLQRRAASHGGSVGVGGGPGALGIGVHGRF